MSHCKLPLPSGVGEDQVTVAVQPTNDPLPSSLSEVIASIARHPLLRLVRYWNWKSAVLSALLRASIFFWVNLTAGWESAVSAAGTELVYRAPVVGTLASLSQSFRRVEPAWKATLAIMVALPALAHGIEFTVHSLTGTARLYESVAASVAFSMFTSVVSYFLHRRDILVVGDGARPLLVDIFHIPGELFDMFVLKPIRRMRGPTTRER